MPFGMQPLRLPLDRMEKDWSESSIQDMKAESQLTTVEVSRSMPMRKTREGIAALRKKKLLVNPDKCYRISCLRIPS
ncbi:hypothetical protein V6N11_063615 [Hibiscus sabdariffa]|uniref:Uncharacterized protein n=1 Tax=Hibiscus sabdariffa TaxID=183260 RepID=A0ABR2PLI1_9ROSI